MARGKPVPKSKSSSRAQQSKKSQPNADNDSVNDDETIVPMALQQKCLNIFRDILLRPSSADADEDARLLQEVKGHLFRRDFAAAFGREDYLRVYAARWSPSRALGYAEVFASIGEHLLAGSGDAAMRVVCLGGGAGAEVVGLAGWLSLNPTRKIHARFVDIAAWSAVVRDLHAGITSPPPLSQYASAAAKAANTALLASDQYVADFLQLDVLDGMRTQEASLFVNTDLVTLMFTLNELYATSVASTQAMLAQLTTAAAPGAHLLVVDSPGSYSTVTLNGTEKKYPMQWLLDHTLLAETRIQKPQWEKVLEDESRWFRLPKGLAYPIELENMRYQIHLYRRLPA